MTSEEEREEKVYFRSVAPVIDKLAPPTLIPSPSSSTGPATTNNHDNDTSTDTAKVVPVLTLSPTIYASTRSFTAQPLDSLEELNNHIILTSGVTMKTIPTHTGTLEKVRIMSDLASLSTVDKNKLPEEKTQEYTRLAITVTDDDDDDSSSEGSDASAQEEGHNYDHLPQLHLSKQADGDDMSVDSSSNNSSSDSSGSNNDKQGVGLDFEGESTFTRLNITENNNGDDDDESADDSSADGSSGGGEEEGDDTGGGGDESSEGEEDEDEVDDDFIVIPIRHSHDTPTAAVVAASSVTAAPTVNAATDTSPNTPLPAPVCPTPAATPSADVTLPPIPPSTTSTDIAEQQALLYKEQGNVCIRNKHYTEAIGNYTMSIEFDPTLASAYNNRASVYITLKVHQ